MDPENDKSAPAAGAEAPAEAPKGVSEADVHALLTSRFRAFEEKIGKTLSETLGALTGKLKEEITSALPKPEPSPTADDKKRKDAPESPELKRLQEQIASLTKQAEDARSERDTERARARDTTLRQKLTDALSGAGIDGVRARNAVGILVDAEKRVRWAEDGEAILFRNADREDDLAIGLKEWLKTEDAKLFLPPRGASGSGDRPGAGLPRAPAAAPTRGDVAEGLRRALLGQL
jgi:hypothetical protein